MPLRRCPSPSICCPAILPRCPKAYEEAAYVDGAGYGRTMLRIIMPMAQPSIITVILFNFLSFWNEYIIAMTMLTDPNGGKTLPVGLMNLMQRTAMRRRSTGRCMRALCL